MTITAYLPQFEKTMFKTGADSWPDNAKIITLINDLNKYTRQRIDGQLTLPADYNGFIRMFQIFGNQFRSSYVYNNDNNKGNAMKWEPVKIITTKIILTVSRE
jgi:hypothetical protein